MSLSTQDILASENGLFGGVHFSDTLGNTGWDTGLAPPVPNILTGHFNKITVLDTSTFTAETVTNIDGLTGTPLIAGTYYGKHTKIQLSGGDVVVYKAPNADNFVDGL